MSRGGGEGERGRGRYRGDYLVSYKLTIEVYIIFSIFCIIL